MSDKYNDVFPTRLRQLIEEKPTTITAVARELGISRQAVSQYTMGIGQPNADKLLQMAEFFDVSVDWLVGRQGGAKSFDMDMEGACRFLGMDEDCVKALQELTEIGKKYPGAIRWVFTSDDFRFAIQSMFEYYDCMEKVKKFLISGDNEKAKDMWMKAQYSEYYMAMGSIQDMLKWFEEAESEEVVDYERFVQDWRAAREARNG